MEARAEGEKVVISVGASEFVFTPGEANQFALQLRQAISNASLVETKRRIANKGLDSQSA